jgi:asparagine synthase (glutamine-hydrolysing)
MSGICGYLGDAAPDAIERMLSAIDYRGDTSDVFTAPGIGLAYRFWKNRPNKADGVLRDGPVAVACAGSFTPAVPSPSHFVRDALSKDGAGTGFDEVDGAFAFAHWDDTRGTLTLGRDPFGVRSLYYAAIRGVFYFATELKQLLTVEGLEVALDYAVIHKYLTFSFCPGAAVPIRGVKRLLPGHLLTARKGAASDASPKAYFTLNEGVAEALREPKEAVRRVRRLGREAVERRLLGDPRVGLYLSGGLDSSSVGVWLKEAEANVTALSLDFGERSVEREQAAEVSRTLGFEQHWVKVGGGDIAAAFDDAVHKLDLPFGDPVTIPQYLLGKAAKGLGLPCIFNGEGGDQLFGGWTSKPMIAAELYAGLYESQEESREETYLRSYHRFYGLEDDLYTPELKERVGPKGQRRAHLRPYLASEGDSFLHRVRLADLSLKGSQNILPRAERMAGSWGLDMRSPFFDRRLAETAFQLPPEMKLHGACEKYVLKRAMRKKLPKEIVWRRKFGMSVPVTDWVLGSKELEAKLDDLLGERSVRARGLFRPEFVARLRAGEDVPSETRRRRVGERIWALAMLEGWLRAFVDKRGRAT